MESTDQYNFNIFKPRNLHGKKNRNVILSMLVIWAVAVFGFQFLLRGIEKPTPEKSLAMFESTWPQAVDGTLSLQDIQTLLASLVHVSGKNTVKAAEKIVVSEAISSVVKGVLPDSVKTGFNNLVEDKEELKSMLANVKDEEYLDLKEQIALIESELEQITRPVSGFNSGSLESTLLISSLKKTDTESLSDKIFEDLPGIMKLYLVHNQSVLTDTKFLGFPFHYFYTAVFLLVLFIVLCIVYNIVIEWRLRQQKVIE